MSTMPKTSRPCAPRAGPPGHERSPSPTRLHRLREVRLQQGLSLRSAARRMQRTVSQIRAEEDENADLLLSTLRRWQMALDVPVIELLGEDQGTLSAPVLKRAKMVKLMKTARAIHEGNRSPEMKCLCQRLIDQLIDIMPELEDVVAWPATGHRRTLDELGRIAENPLPEQLLLDMSEA